MYCRFSSIVSGMPLKNLFSLTDPFGPPSPLAPLSETKTTIVFSSWPDSSRKSSSRPISWSVCDRKPAYTSAMREKSLFSSSESESHGRTTSTWFHGFRSGLLLHVGIDRRQLGVLRKDAELLLALEHELAIGLVAQVEAAL